MEIDRKTGDLGVGYHASIPVLRLAEGIRALGMGVSQSERQATLDRTAEAFGLEALWTFVAVEDDLFLRDCAGPVPESDESDAVLGLLGRRDYGVRRGSGGVRGETIRGAGRRLLVVVFRDDGKGLVVAGRLGRRRVVRGRDLEVLGTLGEALRTADLAERPGALAEETSARQERLLGRLDRAAARAIREALDRVGGDRRQAAELLEVELGLLVREMDRLGLS